MLEYKVLDYAEGRSIFREGDDGDAAYILRSGCVEIYISVKDKKVVLGELVPVTVFGEMALVIPGQTRTANAKAKTRCEVVEIKKPVFDGYLAKTPEFVSILLTTLINRLKHMNELIVKPTGLVQGITAILNLMSAHGIEEADYGSTVREARSAFTAAESDVSDTLKMLEELEFIKIEGAGGRGKTIKILKKNFTVGD